VQLLKIKNNTAIFISLIMIFTTVSCSIMPDNSYNIRRHSVPPSRIVTVAESFLGVPYRYGGADKYGMDCSGFVIAVYKKAYGVDLPHSSLQLYKLGRDVKSGELKTGDLVFFRSKEAKISHVGIYLGSNIFIHASSSRGVTESDITSSYYRKRFLAARRIIPSRIDISR